MVIRHKFCVRRWANFFRPCAKFNSAGHLITFVPAETGLHPPCRSAGPLPLPQSPLNTQLSEYTRTQVHPAASSSTTRQTDRLGRTRSGAVFVYWFVGVWWRGGQWPSAATQAEPVSCDEPPNANAERRMPNCPRPRGNVSWPWRVVCCRVAALPAAPLDVRRRSTHHETWSPDSCHSLFCVQFVARVRLCLWHWRRHCLRLLNSSMLDCRRLSHSSVSIRSSCADGRKGARIRLLVFT